MRDEDLEKQIQDIMRSAKPKASSTIDEIPDTAARECPQCMKMTWRETRHCRHCNLDLFLSDHRYHSQKVSERMLKLAIGLAITGAICIAFSASGLATTFTPGLKLPAGLLGLLLLAGAMKATDDAQRYRGYARQISLE